MSYRSHGRPRLGWWTVDPVGPAVGTVAQWYGMGIQFTNPGRLCGFRTFRAAEDDTIRVVNCIGNDTDGNTFAIARAFYPQQGWPTAGWQNVWFNPMVRPDPNVPIVVAMAHILGNVYVDNNLLLGGPIESNGIVVTNGFNCPDTLNPFGNLNFNLNVYGLDVLFLED